MALGGPCISNYKCLVYETTDDLSKSRNGTTIGVILVDGIQSDSDLKTKNDLNQISNEYETPVINRDWLLDTIVCHSIQKLEKYYMN